MVRRSTTQAVILLARDRFVDWMQSHSWRVSFATVSCECKATYHLCQYLCRCAQGAVSGEKTFNKFERSAQLSYVRLYQISYSWERNWSARVQHTNTELHWGSGRLAKYSATRRMFPQSTCLSRCTLYARSKRSVNPKLETRKIIERITSRTSQIITR